MLLCHYELGYSCYNVALSFECMTLVSSCHTVVSSFECMIRCKQIDRNLLIAFHLLLIVSLLFEVGDLAKSLVVFTFLWKGCCWLMIVTDFVAFEVVGKRL